MTDKELIKQEIEKQIDYAEDDTRYTESYREGLIAAYQTIKAYIDSLPEEPKCIYNRTLDERKKFCKYCSAACDVRIEEEPENEDLEEENPIEGEFPYTNPSDTLQGEIENIFGKLSINGIFTSTKEGFSEVISHFVKWQHNKEQQCAKINERDIVAVGELTGRIRKEEEMKDALQTEYEKGLFDMREEMMKNTVLETKVMMDSDGDGIETPYEEWLTLENTEILYIPEELGLKEGDRVKIIIVKED